MRIEHTVYFELKEKYEKALAFINDMATWNDENAPPDIAQAGQIARELLKELEA